MKKNLIKISIITIIASFFTSAHAQTQADLTGGLRLKIPVMEAKVALSQEDYNFGFSFNSDKLYSKIPVTYKIGHLSSGGIISKMKHPMLSGVGSPFSTGTSTVTGITAALPGLSSFANPVGIFLQLGYNNKKTPLANAFINVLYIPEKEESVFSAFTATNLFNKNLKLKNAFSFGLFDYSENKISSWICTDPYYPAGTHFVSQFASSLEFKNLYLIFSMFTSETPFGMLNDIYRTEIKYSGNHFILSLCSAYNPTPQLLSSSGQKIPEQLQLRTNLQYKETKKLKQLLFYKIGVSSFITVTPEDDEHPLKIATGFQINYGITSVSLASTVNAVIDTSFADSLNLYFESCSLNLSNSWNITPVSVNFSFSASINPAKNYEYISYKYTPKLSVSYSGNPYIKSTASYSVSTKDKEITSRKMSIGTEIDFKMSSFTTIMKLNIELNN